jgi:hypothetical protein
MSSIFRTSFAGVSFESKITFPLWIYVTTFR